MDVDVARQVLAKQLAVLGDELAVVGVERCAANAARELRRRHAADDQAVVHYQKLVHRGVHGTRVAEWSKCSWVRSGMRLRCS
jgi:hypothetical protein